MIRSRFNTIFKTKTLYYNPSVNNSLVRTAVTSKRGIILQEPHRTPFGFGKMIVVVISGLLIGATISKNVANFLEENELFVPSDDDDDDD